MKVHASNYAIQGFTAAVPEAELAALAHEHGLPFIVDLGSGTLVDLEDYGLPHEPTPREALANGADLVTFSGDKLLGGPQCGLIVGRKELIAKIRKNPMKRALRVDKMTLAALEAVLRLVRRSRSGSRANCRRSGCSRARRPKSKRRRSACCPRSQRRARRAAAQPRRRLRSQIGSGALPVDALPSAGIAMTPRGKNAEALREPALATAFRALPVPVIGRIKDGAFILDLRCLDDEAEFVAQLGQLKIAKSMNAKDAK